MENIKFSINLVNGILQYLQTKPYAEVAGLIQSIQKEASDNNVSQQIVETPVAETPVEK